MNWVMLAGVAIVCWGVVGLLQKISSSLLHPSVLLFWVVLGLLLGSVPLLLLSSGSATALNLPILALGLSCGLTNALGSWCLFRALERGAPAALAIPFTALYPLITILMSLIFLHESLGMQQVLGALLAVGGGALISIEPPMPQES
jgi:drug/metabolite transporter (DMT)-like permease